MMSHTISSTSSLKIYIRLLGYVRRYWIAFVLAMCGNVLYSGVDATFTYLLKPIVNKGFVARDIHFIQFLPFLIFGVFILRCVAHLVSNYFMALVSRGVVMRLRQEIFQHLLYLPVTYYDETSSGKILSAIIFNVEQVANAGSDALTDLVQSFCLIVGLLIVMFLISWQLSILYLVTAPVIACAVKLSSKRLRKISLSIQAKMANVMNIAEEAVEGYKVVRLFGGENYEKDKFDQATEKNRQQELKVVVTKSITVSGVQLIAAVALCFTIYLATFPQASTMLSAGSFASLIAAMLALLKPLKVFTNVNNKIQRGLAGAQSVFALLDREREKDVGTKTLDRVKGDIAFQQVSFHYNRSHVPVANGINFEVKAGQTIALVGRSGAGKTTILNLLQRFYDIHEGRILIDGYDIKDIVLQDLRRQFAVVSQSVTLFNDTIAKNVAYGCFENIREAEIITAAKAANAWEFIAEMPDGLSTLVGENGVLLSGGQRQRIAIARAILKNAPILILDEATSALDTESERQIQHALDYLMKNRTTLVIAHRLSTIENADVILVLDDGRLVEQGDHETLLAKGGYYAKLYQMQFRDN